MTTKNAILILALFFTQSFQAFSQYDGYRSTIGLSVGNSFQRPVLNIAKEAFNLDIGQKATPVVQLTYDYQFTNWFSLGVSASRQNFDYDLFSYKYNNFHGEEIVENVNINRKRSTIGLRPLFHYANKMNRIDMYSGLRLQLLSNKLDINTTDEFFDIEKLFNVFLKYRPSMGVVLYGVKYYFTENIAAGLELNLGGPYYVTFGVSGQF